MIILSSRFDLAKGDQEQIKKRMDELTVAAIEATARIPLLWECL